MAQPALQYPGPYCSINTEEDHSIGQWHVRGALGLMDDNVWESELLEMPSEAEMPTGPAAFTGVGREEVYEGAKERMGPGAGLIAQRGASLCGPAAFMFITARHHPERYYRFATTLFETGDAKLGELRIKPGEDCRAYSPGAQIAAVDWVTLAGIRDSENAVFDYDDIDDAFAGITLPGELASWMRKAGYKKVVNETNLYFTKSKGNFLEAVSLHRKGRRVCLFIDLNGIENPSPGRGRFSRIFTSANHWVVLEDVQCTRDDEVKFKIFTWGDDDYAVPPDPLHSGKKLKMSDWLQNYYGYVSCEV